MYLRKARRTKLHGTDWVQSCDTVKSGKSALSRIFLSPQEMQEAASSSSSIQGSIQGRCKSQSRVSMQRLLLCIRIRDHAGEVHQGSLPWAKAATDLPRSEDKRFQSDTLRPPRERKGSRMGATRAQSGSRTSRTFRKSQPLFKNLFTCFKWRLHCLACTHSRTRVPRSLLSLISPPSMPSLRHQWQGQLDPILPQVRASEFRRHKPTPRWKST